MTETVVPLYMTDMQAPGGRRHVGEFHYDGPKGWMVVNERERELNDILYAGKFWDLFTQSFYTAPGGEVIDVTIVPRPVIPRGMTVNQSRMDAGLELIPDQPIVVLVKAWHDAGGIEAVYGPFSETQADWIMENLLEGSSQNWIRTVLRPMP